MTVVIAPDDDAPVAKVVHEQQSAMEMLQLLLAQQKVQQEEQKEQQKSMKEEQKALKEEQKLSEKAMKEEQKAMKEQLQVVTKAVGWSAKEKASNLAAQVCLVAVQGSSAFSRGTRSTLFRTLGSNDACVVELSQRTGLGSSTWPTARSHTATTSCTCRTWQAWSAR